MFNEFFRFYTDVSQKKGENWASFFAQGDASPPPERLRGMHPPTGIPPVSASVNQDTARQPKFKGSE